MNLSGIHALIDSVQTGSPRFPPTLLFNEGWMLRLVLAWFSAHDMPGHKLAFEPGATWFSEALLASPFAPRYRGDRRAEARTHADGIVGHIEIGAAGKADAMLSFGASQLLVIEAKMFSPLSAGTRNAPTYDQAARTVACMAEMLSRAGCPPSQLRSLAFFVVAPGVQMRDPALSAKLTKESIEQAVRHRAAAYTPELDSWVEDWFVPTVDKTQVGPISWEELLADIGRSDSPAAESLRAFYAQCLIHNAPQGRAVRG